MDYIKELYSLTKQYNIAMHLDGARLWNASIATGIHVKEYASYFDTVSVCLSKGLGAPVGSIIAGNKEKIIAARRWRKILGGGMRQAGVLAAAGLYALKNNIKRLADDHEHAKLFAKEVASIPNISIDLTTVQTNMVVCTTSTLPALELAAKCRKHGLLFNPIGKDRVRIVFHLDITRKDTLKAVDILRKALA